MKKVKKTYEAPVAEKIDFMYDYQVVASGIQPCVAGGKAYNVYTDYVDNCHDTKEIEYRNSNVI